MHPIQQRPMPFADRPPVAPAWSVPGPAWLGGGPGEAAGPAGFDPWLALDASPAGLAFLDRNGRFIRVNRRFAALDGLPAEAHVGRCLRDVLPDFAGRLEARLEQVAERGESVRDLVLCGATRVDPLLRRRWVAHAAPVRDPQGDVVAVSLALDEAGGSASHPPAAPAGADRISDESLSVLSHELRGPLSALGNLLRVLEREPLSDPARRMLVIGRRQYARLCRLVEDMLDLSRITRGKTALRREPVDAGRVIREVAEALEPTTTARRQQVTLVLAAEPVWVEADPIRLAQVIENLASNASKYTNPGGSITLSLQRVGEEARIAITDSGIGIEAGDLVRLFEMFEQLESTRDRADGGLGIGLALVRRLVEAHGGRVGVASDGAGQGSTFTVTLPCCPAPHGSRPARASDTALSGIGALRDEARSL
jgi:PAS domain S-box-containing protein